MKTTKLETNKRPVKTAGYSSAKLHAKRARKRAEAEERNRKFQEILSPQPEITR